MTKWKYIKGTKKHYKVSDEGEVMSFARGEPKVLKPVKGFGGYPLVFLGRKRVEGLARIVANAYIKKPFGSVRVCHKDGDKWNNKVDNLYWAVKKSKRPTLRQWLKKILRKLTKKL